MVKSVFADTSYFLALSVSRDRYHAAMRREQGWEKTMAGQA